MRELRILLPKALLGHAAGKEVEYGDTQIRVPRRHGLPKHTSGLMLIRSRRSDICPYSFSRRAPGRRAGPPEAGDGQTPTYVTVPDLAVGMFASRSGTSDWRSESRFVRARRTMTAMAKAGRFCWKDRLRSTVTNTSNSFAASPRSSPFRVVDQPIWRAVFTSWPTMLRKSRQSTHSSRSTFTKQLRPDGPSLAGGTR